MKDKQRILIVDDVPANIKILNDTLRDEYKISAATSGKEALKIVFSNEPPDLILLDVMMPEMGGFEVCQKIKEDEKRKEIPIIFVTAMGEIENETKGLELGAVDYILKPVSPPIVHARVKNQLELKIHRDHLNELVKIRTEEVVQTRLQIIQRLGRAAEYKDNETGKHVIRMSQYCKLIALSYGMDEEYSENILNASPMHDIGKIGIPDNILLKPGKLDDDEWKTMKKHPEIGASIIGKSSSPLLQEARKAALTHHEKWDGSGYPAGLKGEEIPLVGRIAAISDVFDALTNERPYKKAWSIESAVDLIKSEKSKHFDPKVVDEFIKVLPEILKIKKEYAE